jgi:uncharacterized membrane protein
MERRQLLKLPIAAVLLLCLFGLYESIEAMVGLFLPLTPSPAAELFDYPLWSLWHFLPGALFMTLAPLQMWASFRNRHRTIHRWSGRVVVACALFLGVSGLAFPFTMPARPAAEQIFMTLFGVAFLVYTSIAFMAARRRDFARHRRWMIRLVLFGLAITTQRLLLAVFVALGGVASIDEFWRHFVNAAWVAWGLQFAAAEWWLRSAAAARPTAPGPQPEVV